MIAERSYPASVAEPVTDVLHGVRVVDLFRWLEDRESPRVRAWIGEQQRYTRARLDAAPGRVEIRRRVTEFLAIPIYADVRPGGDRVFFLKREAEEQQPGIYVERDGREGRLVNPGARGEGSYTSGFDSRSVARRRIARLRGEAWWRGRAGAGNYRCRVGPRSLRSAAPRVLANVRIFARLPWVLLFAGIA